MNRRNDGTLRFGVREWIGLAALALTPASGFTWWGYQISQRVTAVEVQQDAADRDLATLGDTVTRMLDRLSSLVRLDERLRSAERRLDRIENSPASHRAADRRP